MQGYIKLHRQIIEWEWYKNIPVKILFLHCLLRANHADKKWQGIMIKKGSFITSLDNLAFETGLTKRQVRTALDKLKMTHEVTHKTTHQYSLIIVNNWDKFQLFDTPIDTLATHERHTNDTQMTLNNNDNNDNNENNEKNNIGVEKKNLSNPDFYFSADKIKIFEIYENECKNLIPLTGEKRNRKILDKASNFLTEIDSDWDYYKKLCQEANYLKTIANTKIDFEMMLNCHIGIMNGKYQQDGNKRGVSQEFIDNFFENLRKEEAQNE